MAVVEKQLVKYLSEAHAMEKQALLLLSRGADIVGDEEIARIYRAHRLQTEEHERYVSGAWRRTGRARPRSRTSRILEQEEAAAELVAGTFDRSLEMTMGETPRSPVPSLTPLGKPSERSPGDPAHRGPQDYKDKPAAEPVAQPPDIEAPTEGEREHELSTPGPGHPANTLHGAADRAKIT